MVNTFSNISEVADDASKVSDIIRSIDDIGDIAKVLNFGGVSDDIAKAALETIGLSDNVSDVITRMHEIDKSKKGFSGLTNVVKGAKTAFVDWAKTGTGMATLGAVGLIGGLTFLSSVFDRLNKNVFKVDYGTNLESASKAIDDYTSTTSELESVNSELSTTQQKIAEINAQDSISLSDEAELSRLQEQNNELERKKTLLENMANAQKVAAGSAAALALSTTSEDDVYKNKVDNNLYGMAYADGNGNSADWLTDAEQIKTTADEIVNVNNQLENMKDAQAAATDPKEVKKYQKEIESLSKYQADLNADLSTRVEAASKNYEAILGDPQYAGLAKQYEEAFESVNNIDLSPAERELNNLNKFFDNSKGGKFLKEELMDASDSTTELRDALDSMGISLDDIGVENISTLKRYLDEAKSSADGVSEAISGFDGKLSTVDAAFETENQDANYSKMMEYYNKGNELYNAGLVGTDDFQSLTQMFSPYKINEDDYVYDADGYVEAWENARDSVARYFGNEDPLQGLVNFTDDLRGAELLSDGENGMEWKFKNTAEAADALGQSLEVTEAMLHGMEAYGAEFDDVVFSGEGIEEYKGNLEGIRDIFNSLEDGAYKDWLGNMLEQYDNEYAGLEEDLAGLSEEQIVKIKFEYDMANLRQQIADLQEEAQASGENKDWASVNVANKKYRSQREGETGYDGKDSKSYEQATDNILTLQEQLDDNITDDQKVAVQKQIDGIYDVQNAYQDAFANGEVADWEEYLNSDKAQDVLNEVAKSAGITREELAQLLGTDLGGITPDPIHLKFEGEVDQNELQSQIDAMTIGSTITFDANVDGVQAEVNVIKNTDGSVIYTANVGGVIQEVAQVQHKDGTITYEVVNPPPEEVDPATQGVSQEVTDPVPTEAPSASQGVIRSVIEDISSYLPPIFQTVFRTIVEQKATGTMFSPAQASGTMSPTMLSQAHAYGTGKVSLPRDEVALVNEIGRESRIRSGKWELLPPGMHQEKLKKGDIILSAAQTAALMKYGNSHRISLILSMRKLIILLTILTI
ncbi:MAG: hypothetical protein EOM34_07105 [Clostridia bacterium]|nr:hypothetical protein [Lachnospiraceae bacterium]NCC00435.1 hypothetical protein [Clostridia bacterium]NCD04013.1 hypothetical protein [Clostridia bacterium]